MRRITTLVTLLVVTFETTGSPIIIRTGIGKAEDHGAGESGKVFGANSQAGTTNFDSNAGFDKGDQKKYKTANDAGKYAQEEQNKKNKLDQGDYGAEKYHKVGGGAVSDIGEKAGHKKGHHKSGFHNTYHKDESGSNSSYFDDANNEGDKYNRFSKKNAFGDTAKRRNNGQFFNNNAYNKENGRKGNYANGGRYQKDQGDRKNYNRERYYNDRKHQGRNNAASQFGNSGRKVAEEVRTPQYFQPYDQDYPHEPYPQKITIYEDPRVPVGNGYNDYDRYYDEGLEVRPPTVHPHYEERYYDRRPNYDYYY